MKKFRIALNIACIVLSTILAVMCFYAGNWNVDTVCYTFGFVFSFAAIWLLVHLIYLEK